MFGRPRAAIFNRRVCDLVLFAVTAVELTILLLLTPSLSAADWIYVLQHLIVLAISLTRAPPEIQDRSRAILFAVAVSYSYPYAQVILLQWRPGNVAWPDAGFALVLSGACLSFASLAALGRSFGVRPALRGLVIRGPYRLVRHPMYLSYLLADIGYNMLEWSPGTLLMTGAGWASLVCRVRAEERVLSRDARWSRYAERARYRLLPGLW